MDCRGVRILLVQLVSAAPRADPPSEARTIASARANISYYRPQLRGSQQLGMGLSVIDRRRAWRSARYKIHVEIWLDYYDAVGF